MKVLHGFGLRALDSRSLGAVRRFFCLVARLLDWGLRRSAVEAQKLETP